MGWVSIAHFLNCNKVKQLGISSEKIGEACVGSDEVEVSDDKTKIRRKENAPLPELNTERKRDAKAAGKKGGAAEKEPEEDQVVDGKVILVEKDFDNPLIV